MHIITYEFLKNIDKKENNIIIDICNCDKYKIIYLCYILYQIKSFDRIIIVSKDSDILNIFSSYENIYLYIYEEKYCLKNLDIKKYFFKNFNLENLNLGKETVYIDFELENINLENLQLEKTLKFNNYFLSICSVVECSKDKIGIYLNSKEDTFYITYITKELLKNYNLSFFVFSENIEDVYNLKKIFGDKIQFVYFKNYNFYLFANLINLSFFDSIISYNEDVVTMFLKSYYNINILFFKDIKSEINNFNTNISVVQGCKNRNENLTNSIKSYISNNKIDDVVIVDFNSNYDVKKFVNEKNMISCKIVFIKIVNDTPWIAAWCNNIGMYFAKNNTILKLDADNIILNNNKINEIDTLNSDKKIIHVDWRHAKNENERHLNGVFIVSKNNLKKYGYHDQKNVFYGWEDEEIKKRIKKHTKEEYLCPSYFFHQSQKDFDRLKNQNLLVEFYGFPLYIFNKVDLFIFYNEHISNIYDLEIYEEDVESLFTIKKFERNYIEIEINKEIKKEKCNYNIFSDQVDSCCKFGIFKYLITKKYRIWWLNKNVVDFYYNTVSKYNINEEKDLLLLYIIVQLEFSNYNLNKFTCQINDNTEIRITESLENLYNLFINMKVRADNIKIDTLNKDGNIVYDIINFIKTIK